MKTYFFVLAWAAAIASILIGVVYLDDHSLKAAGHAYAGECR